MNGEGGHSANDRLHDAALAIDAPARVASIEALCQAPWKPRNRVALHGSQAHQGRWEVSARFGQPRGGWPRCVADETAVVGVPLEDHDSGRCERAAQMGGRLPEK